MKRLTFATLIVCGFIVAGCTSPATRVKNIRLDMTPDEVREQMGDTYIVRASKVYENGEWTEIWEYVPPPLALNPRTFWIFFENGRVVQWGEPGDFAGQSGQRVPVSEYSEQKRVR